MKIRILPLLLNYYKLFDKVPEHIAFGFAAYLRFMKVDHQQDGKYFGDYKNIEYLITDDSASYFYEKQRSSGENYVTTVLSDADFWKTDLNLLKGFTQAVVAKYNKIEKQGIEAAVAELTEVKSAVM
jgi:tagaturonate reductase